MARTDNSYRNDQPLKRLKREGSTKHHIGHVQNLPADVEPAPQDAAFIQGQLLRSLTTALAVAGFDSVLPSALESFRAMTEEYMLDFLSTVRQSMIASRRTQPLPQDFTLALASSKIEPSQLRVHLRLDMPEELSAPVIVPPPPAERPPRDLGPMLGNSLVANHATESYIPAHFPLLPSKHSWGNTSVFTQRESDPRKIRERATQEGILAEQALRTLTSANKPRIQQDSERASAARTREKLWQETLSDIMENVDERQDAAPADPDEMDVKMDLPSDDVADERQKTTEMLRTGSGMMVNYDRAHWRRGTGGATIQT